MNQQYVKRNRCAYCGKSIIKRNRDREHVFPSNLYPSSKDNSKVQRLTVPACRDCNKRWSDDEAHFRNILVVAGEKPNSVRKELWEKVLRSFQEADGSRRLRDIIRAMKSVEIDERIRHKVYPGKDERVMRVVKKVVRGLCHHHNVLTAVQEDQVWADVLKFAVPPEFLDQMSYHHREQDIAEYHYQVLNADGINSVWIITFFKQVAFIGLVS